MLKKMSLKETSWYLWKKTSLSKRNYWLYLKQRTGTHFYPNAPSWFPFHLGPQIKVHYITAVSIRVHLLFKKTTHENWIVGDFKSSQIAPSNRDYNDWAKFYPYFLSHR